MRAAARSDAARTRDLVPHDDQIPDRRSSTGVLHRIRDDKLNSIAAGISGPLRGKGVAHRCARSSTACSRVSAAAKVGSGRASSASLWVMPSMQGEKSIAVGTTRET